MFIISPAEEIRGALKQQLERNYKKIRQQYASYILCMVRALEAKKITVENLRTYVLTFPAFKCSNDNRHGMLMSGRKELNNPVKINDIIDLIITDYASFLDYDIFQGIIKDFKLDEGQEELQYPKHLKTYVENHKISELFIEINPALEKYSVAQKVVLKFDIDLSAHKIATILDLKNAVADILGLSSLALRLLSIAEGCVVATFLIPEFVANFTFASDKRFTLKQVKDFQDLSLVWLKCGDCEFPFRSLSDTDIEGLLLIIIGLLIVDIATYLWCRNYGSHEDFHSRGIKERTWSG